MLAGFGADSFQLGVGKSPAEEGAAYFEKKAKAPWQRCCGRIPRQNLDVSLVWESTFL